MRIPTTSDYFENPELAKNFKESLRRWQLKYGFGYTVDDLPQLTFDELLENEFSTNSHNTNKFPSDHYFLHGQNYETPKNSYKLMHKAFDEWTDDKHFEYRSRENDWIMKTACEFLYHWVSFSKDRENENRTVGRSED